MKSVRVWRFCCPYVPSFGLNTERYRVSIRIQPKYGKMQKNTNGSKTVNTDTFHTVWIISKTTFSTIRAFDLWYQKFICFYSDWWLKSSTNPFLRDKNLEMLALQKKLIEMSKYVHKKHNLHSYMNIVIPPISSLGAYLISKL